MSFYDRPQRFDSIDAGFLYDNWWGEIAYVGAAQGTEYVALSNLGDGWFGFQESETPATPELTTMLIFGLGLAGVAAARRMKRK